MLRPSDEIKMRLNVVDVISEYVTLKRAGASFRAPCPFHQEKTPSFYVSAEKQIWHCFGCNEGGDIFGFVMKIEGLEFIEALKILAKKAGVELKDNREAAEKHRLVESDKGKLLKMTALAAAFFKKYLRDSGEAAAAREYLEKRNLSRELEENFLLGYAPDSWDALHNFLRSRGYNDADIVRGGLAIKNERGGIYDRFRRRIMFPIQDISGRVIGFTGRLMPDDEKKENAGGKYVNTPETPLYHKGRVLYCLDKAKQEIRAAGAAIVVEGNMDAISVYGAGAKNVVASSGTALTVEQLALIKRFTNNVILAFDADFAGENAARRGLALAWQADMNVKVIVLPSGAGKDPDDCIRKDPELWYQAVREAAPIMEHLFARTISGKDLKNSEVKKNVSGEMFSVIALIKNPVERDHWLKTLVDTLQISESAVREAFAGYNKNTREMGAQKNVDVRAAKIISEPAARQTILGKRVITLLTSAPSLLSLAARELGENDFDSPVQKRLYTLLLRYYNEKQNLNYTEFYRWLAEESERPIISFFEEVALLGEAERARPKEDLKKEFLQAARELTRERLHGERERLGQEMREAEKSGDQERIKNLSAKFQALLAKESFFK